MPCALPIRSEEHTSELQSPCNLVCRVLFRSDRKSTRLNSSHLVISYAVFCLKKKNLPASHQHATLLHEVMEHAPTIAACFARVHDVAGLADDYYPGSSRFFFFNDTATPEIYTLSLHDALPICCSPPRRRRCPWRLAWLSFRTR